MTNEIVSGEDIIGALLMSHSYNSWWTGSSLSIEEKTPEDLPHDFVMDIAKPYLGKFISTPSDWTPLKNRKVFFKENPAVKPNPDPWQFENFLFVG
ncbi:hypothetical protein EO92_05810 [Methanosarcina sp. 2.H.A.1B.4]|nr:hypothetical protein EO92_05810 [Methanosarcina sp. 2.H.A.1B.4]